MLGIQNLAWTSPPLLPRFARLVFSVIGTERLIIGRALKVPVHQVAGSPDAIPPARPALGAGGPLNALSCLAPATNIRTASMFSPACLLKTTQQSNPAARPHQGRTSLSRPLPDSNSRTRSAGTRNCWLKFETSQIESAFFTNTAQYLGRYQSLSVSGPLWQSEDHAREKYLNCAGKDSSSNSEAVTQDWLDLDTLTAAIATSHPGQHLSGRPQNSVSPDRDNFWC